MANSIRGKSVEKEGYMWVKQPNLLKGKKWQWKYIVLTNHSQPNSSACLELYESNVAFLTCASPESFITLDNINYVGEIESQKKDFSFCLLVGKKQEQLATKDEVGRIEWIEAIKQLRYKQPTTSSTSCRASAPCDQQNSPAGVSSTIDARGCFLVKFKRTTSNSLLLRNEMSYLLHVGARCITVGNSTGSKEHVLSWPLSTIRSYKSVSIDSRSLQKMFTIETGRQSTTGSGIFYFLTSFADQIADQIRLKTNRSYLAKVGSMDTFFSDNGNSSNQKTTSARLSSARPRFSTSPGRIRASASSNSAHVCDSLSETSQDAFGNYITEDDGLYIHVLTCQKDVEERRRSEARRASQSNSEREPGSPDDERASYIDVLEQEPVVDCLAYIELVGDSEPSDQSLRRNRSRGPPGECGEDIYTRVLEDDEEAGHTEESGASGECDERDCGTRDETRDDMRYESREPSYVSRHDSRHDSQGEVRATMESVSSGDSELWPHSPTSQTSSFGYTRSASSEEDVFVTLPRIRIASDFFPELEEPPTSADDIPEQISDNNNNSMESFGETSVRKTESVQKNGSCSDLSLLVGEKDKIVDGCDGEEIMNCRNECKNSGDTCVNSGNACVDSGEACANFEIACANSGNACANSGNACVNFENACSTSENTCSDSGNTCVNSGDTCDKKSSEMSSWPSETGKDTDDSPEPREDSTNDNTTSPEKATTIGKKSKPVIIEDNSSKSSTKAQKCKSPKKEKNGKFFHRFRKKFQNSPSVEDVEQMGQNTVQDSLFVRNLKKGNLSVHAHVLESERVKRGLAPSPAQNAHALSFGGNITASTNSSPPKNENMVTQRLLTATRRAESLSGFQGNGENNCLSGYNALSKALTYTPARDVRKEPRKRATSSCARLEATQSVPEVFRQSSCPALPSLPEGEMNVI